MGEFGVQTLCPVTNCGHTSDSGTNWIEHIGQLQSNKTLLSDKFLWKLTTSCKKSLCKTPNLFPQARHTLQLRNTFLWSTISPPPPPPPPPPHRQTLIRRLSARSTVQRILTMSNSSPTTSGVSMVSARYFFVPVCLGVFIDVLFSGGCAEDEGKKLCPEDKRRLRLAIHLSFQYNFSITLRITKSQPLLKMFKISLFVFCLHWFLVCLYKLWYHWYLQLWNTFFLHLKRFLYWILKSRHWAFRQIKYA